MRTTLDIDSDLLEAAKEIAAREKTTAGAVISRLARKGFNLAPSGKKKIRNGIPVFPATGDIVTSEHIRRIMDDEAI